MNPFAPPPNRENEQRISLREKISEGLVVAWAVASIASVSMLFTLLLFFFGRNLLRHTNEWGGDYRSSIRGALLIGTLFFASHVIFAPKFWWLRIAIPVAITAAWATWLIAEELITPSPIPFGSAYAIALISGALVSTPLSTSGNRRLVVITALLFSLVHVAIAFICW